jgi:hypothetical protein
VGRAGVGQGVEIIFFWRRLGFRGFLGDGHHLAAFAFGAFAGDLFFPGVRALAALAGKFEWNFGHAQALFCGNDSQQNFAGIINWL